MTSQRLAGVGDLLAADDYTDDRDPGSVVGTEALNARRGGVDVEGLIGIDNGALRLRPLAKPGWGREGLAYGPFERRPGLAFAVLANNGHNASQTYYMPETPKVRLRRWLGDLKRGRWRRPRHHENFAVGWFPTAVPPDPLKAGNGFVMHAATADNGELWAVVDGRADPVVLGVQNVPILYVVVLRQRGAAYYTASLPGTAGVGSYPYLKPLALDSCDDTPLLHAGLQQRILGEVGYRVDTRVYGTRVADIPEWSEWYGSAHAADALRGSGGLEAAEAGGVWRTDGSVERTSDGLRCPGRVAVATLTMTEPSGLVGAKVRIGTAGAAGLVFRSQGEGGWAFVVGSDGCRLLRRDGTAWVETGVVEHRRMRPRSLHSLQVLDNDGLLSFHLDGRLVFGRRIDDTTLVEATGVGVLATDGFTGSILDFEAHPSQISLPEALAMEPPSVAPGDDVAIFEDFDGAPADLASEPGNRGVRWERSEGAGCFERTGAGGARVKATREQPNPGRTIYTTEWPDPDYADVTVDLTHPGTAIGQKEAGRGGIVFWQDEDNYLVVNLFVDDTFNGASISTFYHLGGKEVMWDAVWTLVPGCAWGTRNVMEVRFDGRRFLALLDGRPSLYRALTDVYPDAAALAIRRVGLIANWEWGDDTGTVFHRFEGRLRRDDDDPDGARVDRRRKR